MENIINKYKMHNNQNLNAVAHNSNEHYKKLANDFGQYYYNLLNTNPDDLKNLFKPFSILKYQDEEHCCTDPIVAKLKANFQSNVKYHPLSLDCLHSGSRRINILICGKLNNNWNFSEYVHLAHDGNSFWIQSSIIRLFQ